MKTHHQSETRQFFSNLYHSSVEVVNALPLTFDPPEMSYISAVIGPAVVAAKSVNPFGDLSDAVKLECRATVESATDAHRQRIGLNTVGLLLDRLSILSIKHWNLVNRAKSPEKTTTLVDTQVRELLDCLGSSILPGYSSINNKLTSHAVETTASTFGGSYLGLLTTNALLWEAQEVLYNHDINVLPDQELRAYIRFFSTWNITRNSYIESTDRLYWATVTS